MTRLLLPIYYFRCAGCSTRTVRVTPRAVLEFVGRIALAASPFLFVWWLVQTFTTFYIG